MLKYSKAGISVLVTLDTRRAKLDGRFPVKIEVVYRRKQKYYPVGLDLLPEQWTAIGKSRKMPVERSLIEDAFLRTVSETEALALSGSFSLSALDSRLKYVPETCSLNSMMRELSENCLCEGRTNSYFRYRSTINAISQFAGDDVKLSDVSAEWLGNCERFWLHQGKSPTTVSVYMKTLKSVMNRAVDDGLLPVSDFPFGRGAYRIPPGRERKIALNREQIRMVMDFKGNRILEENRDLWLFSYLCNGINFRDMIYLQYRNIEGNEICFTRSKTKLSSCNRTIRAAFTERMREIIDNIGNPYDGNPDTFLFRCSDGSSDDYGRTMHVRKVVTNCNRALSVIASRLGIPKFTTYSARHSFASILNWSGVDLYYISQCLGHSNLNTTKTYLAGFAKEDRLKIAELLTDL